MDSIYLGDLQPDTLVAIHAYYEALGMSEVCPGVYWDPERVCELYFRLKYSHDSPLLFPHGKWATLQAIEERIVEALRDEGARKE